MACSINSKSTGRGVPAGRPYLFLAVASFLLFAGDRNLPAQQPTYTSDVKVVNVLATVRDKKGHIVRNLTKDDFSLSEDSTPQTIAYFTRESDLPLTLGLLVDTSLSQRRVLDQERSASYTFLDQLLRLDKDVAFVIHFDREVELLQDLTASRKQLQTALDSLQVVEFRRNDGGNSSGSGGRGRGVGTALYDAIYLASNEVMKRQQGRKALIILSDGVDNGSKVTMATAIESAQRADTLVYSVLFADEEGYGRGGGGFGGPRIGMGGGGGGMGRRGGMGGGRRRYPQESRPDGKKVLERISTETGARLFEVSKKETIEKIYSDIEEELRNQYSLGYTPTRADASAGFRKITLTTHQKDLVVQARDGYYTR